MFRFSEMITKEITAALINCALTAIGIIVDASYSRNPIQNKTVPKTPIVNIQLVLMFMRIGVLRMFGNVSLCTMEYIPIHNNIPKDFNVRISEIV